MSDLVIFTPKSQINTEKNLKDFITFSESLPNLNEYMNYSSKSWKGLSTFTKLGTHPSDKNNELHSSLLPFAKAYVLYSQTQNRSQNFNEIKALRVIEVAMLKSHGSVFLTKITPLVLDNAAQIAREHYCKRAAYHTGCHIQKLQEFLVKKLIIPEFTWKNPNKRGDDTVDKIGKAGTENRQQKLPDENALLAIAEIFSLDDNNLSKLDLFTSSSIALLLCAPARGSELFYLKTDCLHYDKDSSGKEVVGLKWYSGKGFGHEVEWIPDSMVNIAEKAVKRLNTMSIAARKWAKQMEMLVEAVHYNEKHTFPRHKLCPDVVSDTTLLDLVQTANALGYKVQLDNPNSISSSARSFLIRRGIKIKGWKITDKKYCLRDLIPKLIEKLPNGFPYVKYGTKNHPKVKWSEVLFCSNRYEYQNAKSIIPTELWIPTINTLNEDIAKTKKKNKRTKTLSDVKSIFERHNYPGVYRITSHQFRHMLSTMAKINGMEEQVLTKWAGRTDGKHNRVYNHTTPQQYQEMASLIKQRNNEESVLGFREFEISTPETLQEINTLATQTAHLTEFGACIHDYIMSPCSKHRDCINCEEQVCIKGDDIKLERLKTRLERENILISGDKAAVGEDLLNADRHYQKRLITIKRCEELIEILSDDNVPDGSAVKLSTESVSHLDLVMDKNYKKRLPKLEKYNKNKVIKLTRRPRVLALYKSNKES